MNNTEQKDALKQALYMLKGAATELPTDEQANVAEIELKIKLFIEETLKNYEQTTANFGLSISAMILALKVAEFS